MSKIISGYKYACAVYNRLMEVFPHATENDDAEDLINKTHKLTHVNEKLPTISKCTLGKIDFYTYTSSGFEYTFDPTERIFIEGKYDALKYVDFRKITEVVDQYIETGSCDFQAVLKNIFEKEKRAARNKELSKEVEIIKKELLRKGRLLIDTQFHEFFTEFPIDKEGYHLAV